MNVQSWLARILPFALIVVLAAVSVAGDACIKRAADARTLDWRLVVAGASVYGSTAIGWLYVLRRTRLAIVGPLYASATVILLTLVGIFVFSERMSAREWIGLCLAVASVVLLSRMTA